MKAIVVDEPKKASIHDIPEFPLRPDYVKIKVRAVALNPTDWKHIDYIAKGGEVVGCDVAGVVEEVGDKVTTSVKPGDAVFGFVHGSNLSNHEDGGFAEHCLVKDGLFIHKPDNLSFEEAASLPVAVGTTGQAAYHRLGLPFPNASSKPDPAPPVLIYGGSTATGSIAVQFAALSGLKVISTASPRNHEWIKSLGAEKVFDYNDPECGSKIREYTGDRLRDVFDTITLPDSFKIAAEALSSTREHGELQYVGLLPPKGFPRNDDVKATSTMLYTAIGEPYTKMGRDVSPGQEDIQFVREWYKLSAPLISEGKIKPHPIEVGKGFEGVLDGLDRMRRGDYSAKKLVYTIA